MKKSIASASAVHSAAGISLAIRRTATGSSASGNGNLIHEDAHAAVHDIAISMPPWSAHDGIVDTFPQKFAVNPK